MGGIWYDLRIWYHMTEVLDQTTSQHFVCPHFSCHPIPCTWNYILDVIWHSKISHDCLGYAFPVLYYFKKLFQAKYRILYILQKIKFEEVSTFWNNFQPWFYHLLLVILIKYMPVLVSLAKIMLHSYKPSQNSVA